jgi:hypothetical protein
MDLIGIVDSLLSQSQQGTLECVACIGLSSVQCLIHINSWPIPTNITHSILTLPLQFGSKCRTPTDISSSDLSLGNTSPLASA